jgi:hypothetical protein
LIEGWCCIRGKALEIAQNRIWEARHVISIFQRHLLFSRANS